MSDVFSLRVDDDLELVLRERWTNAAINELIERNLDRLRQWEQWAQTQPDLAETAERGAQMMHGWVDGANVHTAIRYREEIVGTIGARIEHATSVATIGYWIDGGFEGRGIVTRSARALIAHLFARHAIERIEIRAAVDNERSRAVPERLGFTHEGTLRAAHAVGDVRKDEAVYGLLRAEWSD
jgi:ribosomal-protein-serine acetyltransferase